MELVGDRWAGYSTNFVDTHEDEKLETYSLGELRDTVTWMIQNAKKAKKDIYNIPVFIKDGSSFNDTYIAKSSAYAWNGAGENTCEFTFYKDGKLTYTAPDSKPEKGEYWASRGPGYPDVSGFVKSKLAGERLLRLVKYVLDTDNPKTFLDYREYEPDWIQFKFHQDEFDIDKLDKMARDNNDIITEEIIRDCVK